MLKVGKSTWMFMQINNNTQNIKLILKWCKVLVIDFWDWGKMAKICFKFVQIVLNIAFPFFDCCHLAVSDFYFSYVVIASCYSSTNSNKAFRLNKVFDFFRRVPNTETHRCSWIFSVKYTKLFDFLHFSLWKVRVHIIYISSAQNFLRFYITASVIFEFYVCFLVIGETCLKIHLRNTEKI